MAAHCASETALSLSESHAPTCQPRPPTSRFLAHVRKKKRHRLRSLSREEAHHARLRLARAAPCWLGSIHALWKPTVPARRPSPSVQGPALTCQPRPPTSSVVAHVRMKKIHRMRPLSREVAYHARLRRARLVALVVVAFCSMDSHCASERASPSVHDSVPTCQPRSPTSSFLAHMRKKKCHRARTLSQEEAHHARLRRAHAAPRWLESFPVLR